GAPAPACQRSVIAASRNRHGTPDSKGGARRAVPPRPTRQTSSRTQWSWSLRRDRWSDGRLRVVKHASSRRQKKVTKSRQTGGGETASVSAVLVASPRSG